MPYIDCTDIIEINSSVETVFNTVADYANWNVWNPIYQCTIEGANKIEVGSIVNHQYGKKPFVLSKFSRSIDGITPNEKIEESYVKGDLLGKGEWQFTPKGNTTIASYTCKINSNTLVTHISFALIGKLSHRIGFIPVLKNLKKHCESL